MPHRKSAVVCGGSDVVKEQRDFGVGAVVLLSRNQFVEFPQKIENSFDPLTLQTRIGKLLARGPSNFQCFKASQRLVEAAVAVAIQFDTLQHVRQAPGNCGPLALFDVFAAT